MKNNDLYWVKTELIELQKKIQYCLVLTEDYNQPESKLMECSKAIERIIISLKNI